MKSIQQFSVIILLLFFSTNISAQRQSIVKMSAAEYQSLMETIIKGKKRKAARRRYYVVPPVQTTTYPPAANNQPTQNNNATTNKKNELQELYAQLILDQQKEGNNKAELEAVKQSLLAEMQSLDTQLRAEQKENEQLTNRYYEKSIEEDGDLEYQIRALQNELINQKRTSQELEDAIDKLNNSRKDWNEDQERDLVTSKKEFNKELEILERQIYELEKDQLQYLEIIKTNGNNKQGTDVTTILLLNKELSDLRSKVQLLENEKHTIDVPVATINPNVSILENKIKTLEEKVNQLSSKKVIPTSTLENKTNTTEVPSTTVNPNVSILENKIKALEEKVNQLSSKKVIPSSTPDYTNQLKSLKAQIRQLESKINTHNHSSNNVKTTPVQIPAPKVIVVPTPTPTVSVETRNFIERRRQQNIFFPNGSAALTETEKNKIRELSQQLSIHQQVDITIKAFASNTGSFAVNQKLSQQRAENVKNTLIQMGVQPTRLSLQPLGIDTQSVDPANARRAEIHLIISGDFSN